MARPRVKPEDPDEKLRIQTQLPPDWVPRWEALEQHYGTTRSAVASDIIRDAILMHEGGNNKDAKLDRIEAAQKHLEGKVNMLLLLVWGAPELRTTGVKFSAEDVQRLRALIDEIVL